MINKTSLKFIAVFVAIVAISLISLYILQTYFSPERQAARRLADLERLYEEDTYGGQTPEETLQLFIGALKAGDIELASRYFVIEKRGEWLENLESIKKDNLLVKMVSDLERPKEKKLTGEDRATFYIYNDNNQLAVAISIGRLPNAIWKIIDM